MLRYGLKRGLLLIPTLLLVLGSIWFKWTPPLEYIPLSRSAVLQVKENEYIMAAKAIGCRDFFIIFRHILPNVTAPIIVIATMGLGNAILAESALSFLGFGVPPPAPSWGRMLSGDGLVYMLQAPWLAVFPGLAISLAAFGFNMLGDALRDLLDPKLTGGARGTT